MKHSTHQLSTAALAVIMSVILAACGATITAAPAATVLPEGSAVVGTGNLPQVDNSVVEAAASGDLATLYDRVGPSVVHIQVMGPGDQTAAVWPDLPQIPGLPDLPALPPGGPVRGEGSGFVWDSSGHIVTNNHVVAGAEQITVILADGSELDATLVGTDPDSDLAVLQVDPAAVTVSPVRLADSTTLRVGDLAVAIGNPFGQEGTMTVGIISALGRLLPVEGGATTGPRYNIPDVIQTDAAINPGNSGGVLLNSQGEVVGVTSAIISPVRASAGVGFAIPAAIVQQVVPALIADGHYDHPYLGITGTDLTPDLAQAMDLAPDQRGALVVAVAAGSPAAAAGLRGSDRQVTIDGAQTVVGGDVIVAVDGRPVTEMEDLIADLSRNGVVGAQVALSLLRDGGAQVVSVTLAARPSQAESAATETVQAAYLGIVGRDLTPAVAQAMDLPADQQGVLIEQVQAGGPADVAGLLGSDTSVALDGEQVQVGGDIVIAVDGQPVTDLASLRSLLARHEAGDEVTVQVLRDGSSVPVSVTLGRRE